MNRAEMHWRLKITNIALLYLKCVFSSSQELDSEVNKWLKK